MDGGKRGENERRTSKETNRKTRGIVMGNVKSNCHRMKGRRATGLKSRPALWPMLHAAQTVRESDLTLSRQRGRRGFLLATNVSLM